MTMLQGFREAYKKNADTLKKYENEIKNNFNHARKRQIITFLPGFFYGHCAFDFSE